MYNDHKVKPLHIMLPKTSAYVKSYDGQTKWMYFFITDDGHENLVVMRLQIFMIKKNPKVDSNHTYLSVISLDSALKKDENYYQQVLLKECKYIEEKVIRHINDNLSDFSYSDESDEE